jgi:murein DD-endopeptidase MepM/ murein hydrolase activator NlpD
MTKSLQYPVQPYIVEGYSFGTRVRSRIILWARHLGDDVILKAGTEIVAAGDGRVVLSELRPGSQERRNWGGVVIIEHIRPESGEKFYSVYGHMKDVRVKMGDMVQSGQVVGVVAEGLTAENGWWKIPHLHFAIYVGPWLDMILPGYKRFFDDRTKFSWWRDPRTFIEDYNRA